MERLLKAIAIFSGEAVRDYAIRNRAAQTWDYERLILEAFPEVFELKCLPHIDENNTIAPGHIKLILVPDMRFRQGKDPLQPKNSLAFLRQVETFLQDGKLGGFVTPHAANPEYETLLIDCKIDFMPGFDPGFYSLQLQEDIRRFLSPWLMKKVETLFLAERFTNLK
jgi:hypothetical protein